MSYVVDVDYVRGFQAELAPAWLDHVAIISGFTARSTQEGFTWCDLGCGQGGSAVLLAATHPHGQFFGIDMMPTHIEHARRLATDGAVSNVQFFNADFAAAAGLDLPQLDYIVSHGVYTWIDPAAQLQLRTFIQRHLKPGGLVYLSYNAMPGRGPDIAYQYLLRTIAETVPGNSLTRAAAAVAKVRRFAELKPLSLERTFAQIDPASESQRLPMAYLAHEFLGGNWKPLFVTEVRAAMSTIGLKPVGSATLLQNYDSFVLRKPARDTLTSIADRDLRELVRDFFLDQRFRRDVFVSEGRGLDEKGQRHRLLDSTFCLTRPESTVTFEISTSAGELRFDNPFARKVVLGLSRGPKRLSDMLEDPGEIRNLLANLLVLCAARIVRPVEGGMESVKALNETILQRLDGPEQLTYLALPCGTALNVEANLLRKLRDKTDTEESYPGWKDFLELCHY